MADFNSEMFFYEAVCYLAQLGHKRIGGIFCIDEIDDSFLMARKRGFLKAISQINLDQDESLIGPLHDPGHYLDRNFIAITKM